MSGVRAASLISPSVSIEPDPAMIYILAEIEIGPAVVKMSREPGSNFWQETLEQQFHKCGTADQGPKPG
jgi:hypothetical protein